MSTGIPSLRCLRSSEQLAVNVEVEVGRLGKGPNGRSDCFMVGTEMA